MTEKKFKLKKEDIIELYRTDGPMGCIASDRIMVNGKKVGYMYHDADTTENADSGWRFLAGDESDSYINNPEHSGVYSLNTIANYDRDIIPFLDAAPGSAFIRDESGNLIPDTEEDLSE